MLRRRDMNSGAERDRCTPLKHQQGKRVFNISVNAASGRLTKQAFAHVLAASGSLICMCYHANIPQAAESPVAYRTDVVKSRSPSAPDHQRCNCSAGGMGQAHPMTSAAAAAHNRLMAASLVMQSPTDAALRMLDTSK